MDNKFTPLPIEEDRIIVVQIEIFPAEYIFVLQVYFPCSNYSIAEYRDVLHRLDNYINFYAERRTVITMGDFNTNLKYHRRFDSRSKALCALLNSNNHVAINTLALCEGATSTFVSYDGKFESFTEYIILPVEKVDTVNECVILDDDALNVSQHRPIFCSIRYPQFRLANVDQVPDRIIWKKVDTDMVNDFQMQMENHNSLTAVINSELKDSLLTRCIRRLPKH